MLPQKIDFHMVFDSFRKGMSSFPGVFEPSSRKTHQKPGVFGDPIFQMNDSTTENDGRNAQVSIFQWFWHQNVRHRLSHLGTGPGQGPGPRDRKTRFSYSF